MDPSVPSRRGDTRGGGGKNKINDKIRLHIKSMNSHTRHPCVFIDTNYRGCVLSHMIKGLWFPGISTLPGGGMEGGR